jgi:hypothetical protein
MPSILSIGLVGALAAFVHGIPASEPTQGPDEVSAAADPLCQILGCPIPATITTTRTETKTETETATVTAPCPTKPTLIPFPCNPGAYILQANTLTYLDLPSGASGVIISSIRPALGDINAMGFHPHENHLYAIQGAELIRIGLDGAVDVVLTIPNQLKPNVGEFDLGGQFWFGRDGVTWGHVDLLPGSPTYGQLVESGTMTVPADLEVADWAFTPSSPGYMYSIGTKPNGAMSLIRWSTSTHEWETVASGYGDLGVTPTTFGAMMGTSDGIIYGLDNGSGRVFRFSVLNTNVAGLAGQGTASSRNEGARCFLRRDVP